MSHKINHANIKDWAANYDGPLFDGILCDPPYELGFMGKSWDSSGIAFDTDMWADLFKLVKPGGHLLAFSGSRTYHRMAVAIEDAGFEIRDMIEWVYGCLSEDTEILTESGYKFFKDISKDEKICIYNKDNNSYSYERPEKWSSYKVDNEDCYSIKSDDTDQIVSKNHRCLVERNGKLEFEFAENLREKEIVPLFEGNKVYNGDCLEVLAGIPDKSIDMVLTSPPYDNLRDYKGYTFNFEGIAKEIYRVLKDGGVCVWIVGDATIKGSETGTSFKQALYFKEIGFNLHDTMIYRKINYIPLTHNRYEQEFEYMFIFSKGKPKTFNPIMVECKTKGSKTNGRTFYQTNNQNKPTEGHKNDAVKEYKQKGNVWEIPTNAGTKGHPAQFPEKLAEDHMLSWSNEGDTILDPMAGSGTTLKMAKKNNRNYIGIEIAEEYCDLIHERTQDKPNTTLATIEKIKYTGTIFCPTVSTGAFIARRNGQVFITGNSGFPKSLNIGKAVDKQNGSNGFRGELKLGGERLARLENGKRDGEGKWGDESGRDPYTYIPETEAAKQYEGYGTALKPAHEPCVLARKPIEGTVANNVLKHGTGGLNIDGTRVQGLSEKELNWTPQRHNEDKRADENVYGGGKGFYPKEEMTMFNPTGRFPANLIHDGSDEVEAVFPQNAKGMSGGGKHKQTYSKDGVIAGGGHDGNDSHIRNDSGSASRFFMTCKDTQKHAIMSVWNDIHASIAEDNSTITALIEKVMNITSALESVPLNIDLVNRSLNALFVGEKSKSTEIDFVAKLVAIKEVPEDLVSQEELKAIQGYIGSSENSIQIQSRVSTAESKGNTDITQIIINCMKLCGYVLHATDENTKQASQESDSDQAKTTRFLYTAKASKSERNAGLEGFEDSISTERTWSDDFKDYGDGETSGHKNLQPQKNHHPTVKPLSLTKYLATLIKPPTGGRLLVPFSGSGSEMIGALQAGWEYVEGVELTEEYIPIAEARIKHWVSKPVQVTLDV